MKEFLREFFEEPENGTVQEKVVLSRGIMVLVNVLVILGILGITAYAFFGAYASSPVIPLKAAQFQVELSLSVTDTLGTTQLMQGQTDDRHTTALEAGKTYTFTLKPSGTAQTGFCILTATDCTRTYYTQQLGMDAAVSGGRTEKIVFTVIPAGNTVITLDTSWGTSALYGRVDKSDAQYIFDGETVNLSITGAQQPITENIPEATDPTTPAVTEPTVPEATTEPTTPAVTEPTVPEATTEPTTPAVTEPTVPEATTELTTPVVTEPTVPEATTEPTTPAVTEPTVPEATTEPTTPVVTEPTVPEATTELTTPVVTEPTVPEATTEPTTPVETEPAQQETTPETEATEPTQQETTE